MNYDCLTLKEILYEFNEDYWVNQNFETDKPYYQFIENYIKQIQDYAIVIEVPEKDDGFNNIKKHKLYLELNEWLHNEEMIYNNLVEAINEMSSGSSSTEQRFNDTPQSQGNYSASSYTSTITTSKATGELSSEDKMRLLENVRRNAVMEFNRRFVIYES